MQPPVDPGSAGEICFSGDGFTVSRIVVGTIDNNAYLVRCDTTGAGVLVDAADNAETLLTFAERASVSAIVTTHGHWDHHQAAKAVGVSLGVIPSIHSLDAFMVDDTFGTLEPGPLRFGDIAAEIVHTPGHTPGSVCVALEGVVLTGDTLFPGGPGATRFDHSSFDTIIESIRMKLFSLGDRTVVLPGHGAATTIGAERDSLQDWIDRGW